MAVQKVPVEQFLSLAKQHPVLDVRSPAEFVHGHIPQANSLPLFTDEERRIVGTAYKQQSRQQAVKAGLDYFGVKMKRMVEEAEALIAARKPLSENSFQPHTDQIANNIVLVHCWRGGMRSGAVAWLLDLYGYKVYTLAGGYKAFRNHVLQSFETLYNFRMLGGYAGSGKTELIRSLRHSGQPVIDLEAIAQHKGSAFGGLGENAQPSQEMFENLLSLHLYKATAVVKNMVELDETGLAGIWMEDESQRIGNLNIPNAIWQQMRRSPIYFMDIPFKERLNYLAASYGGFPRQELAKAIIRMSKRLGGLETRKAIDLLEEDNIVECFKILLNYYDKWYTRALSNRNAGISFYAIPGATVDTGNSAFLLHTKALQQA